MAIRLENNSKAYCYPPIFVWSDEKSGLASLDGHSLHVKKDWTLVGIQNMSAGLKMFAFI